jgi:hypothetical protein
MKRGIYNLLLIVVVGVMNTSCEVDDYAEPDGTLTGTVIDSYTKKPIVTEQPNGFQVRCEQIEYSEKVDNNPVLFWGRADGTFTNTKVFAGKYKISLSNGAFTCDETPTIDIKSKGVTSQNFTVTPYLGFVEFSVVKDGDAAKITFTVHKVIASATPDRYFVHLQPVSPLLTPNVGENSNTYDPTISISNKTLTAGMLDVPIVERITGLTAGKQYYVRVGARCVGVPASRYNMTEIKTVNM